MKPIVIIPGLGGSLLVNIDNPKKNIFNREVINNRWININPFSQKSIIKWKKDMYSEFEYNSNNKIIGYKNYKREIIPYDMFGINGIQNLVGDFELLNDNQKNIFEKLFRYKYFEKLNTNLLSFGYTPNKDLIGVPWDFRLFLDSKIRSFIFIYLKYKIEKIVEYNEDKAIIVTHSLGGILIKLFLEEINKTDREWSNKYIEDIFLLNVPYSGTPSAIKAILIGEAYVPFTNNLFVNEMRNNSGIIMSIPNNISYTKKDIFWSCDTGEQITLDNIYDNSINNIAFKAWKDMYYNKIKLVAKKNNTKVTVINSFGIDTPECYLSKTLNDMPYKILNTNGDGIVTKNSLESYKNIFTNYDSLILENVEHTEIISHPIFLESLFDKLF